MGEFRRREKVGTNYLLIGLLLCGALLRAAVLFLSPYPIESAEADRMRVISAAVQQGVGYPDSAAYDDPLYPFILGTVEQVVFVVSGKEVVSAMSAVALNVLFDLLSAWLIFLLTRSRFGSKPALWSTAIWIVYPAAMIFSTRLLPDSLFVLLSLLTVFLYDRLEARNWPPLHSLALGVCLGLLTLTKTVGLIFAIAYFIYIVLIRYETSRALRFRSAALILVGLVVLILPWMIRNAAVHDYYALNTRGPAMSQESRDWRVSVETGVRQVALLWNTDQFMVNSPGAFCAWKGEAHHWLALALSVIIYVIIVVLGTAAIYLVPHFDTRGLYILFLFLACMTAMFTAGHPRDHFVFMPWLVISACALIGKQAWSSAPQWRRIALLLALGMFGGVWMNEVMTLFHI